MNVPKHVVETTVMALYKHSPFGRARQRETPSKANDIYEDFIKQTETTRPIPTTISRL